MHSMGKDLQVFPLFSAVETSLTAGGSGDNTAINGAAIDLGSTVRPQAENFACVIHARGVLAATKLLNVSAKVQDSADGSTWADVEDKGVVLTLTGGSGGTTETGAVRVQHDANKLRKYARWVVTPDLTASGTDTAKVGSTVLLAGLHNLV